MTRRLSMPAAAMRMRDAVLGESCAEALARVRGGVVGRRASGVPGWMARAATAASRTLIASSARQRTASAQAVISRVQQSIAGANTSSRARRPRCWHVHVPQLIRPGDLEVPGPLVAALAALGLQQAVLAHQSLHALAIHCGAELSRGERGDHPCRRSGSPARPPRPGRSTSPSGRRWSLRRPLPPTVDRLAADPGNPGRRSRPDGPARPARGNRRRAPLLPAPQEFPPASLPVARTERPVSGGLVTACTPECLRGTGSIRMGRTCRY